MNSDICNDQYENLITEGVSVHDDPLFCKDVKEATLTKLTDAYRFMHSSRSLPDDVAKLQELIRGLSKEVGLQRTQVLELQRDLNEERTKREVPVSSSASVFVGAKLPAFIKNMDSGVWHKVRESANVLAPAYWRAKCGWYFAFADFAGANGLDVGPISHCPNCLPVERAAFLRSIA